MKFNLVYVVFRFISYKLYSLYKDSEGEIREIRHKNRLYRKYISGGKKREDQNTLQEYTFFVSNLITTTRDSYFVKLGKRLNDPTTAPKTYWFIFLPFL